jgi:hypothetical protein
MNLTPQQRLIASRRAIVQSMNRDRREHRYDSASSNASAESEEAGQSHAAGATRSNRANASGLNSLWRSIRRTASAWWRSNPACLAVDVVQPVVEKYAQANPLKLIGIAAVAGAVVVIAKPWRLISVTAVLSAALRSTQMSSLIASFLYSPPDEQRDP